ncbi:hypothetical protein BN1723_020036, partial [Verticillium longisporum]
CCCCLLRCHHRPAVSGRDSP